MASTKLHFSHLDLKCMYSHIAEIQTFFVQFSIYKRNIAMMLLNLKPFIQNPKSNSIRGRILEGRILNVKSFFYWVQFE